MRPFFGTALAAVLVVGTGGPARADADQDAQPVLDKAIKALGGEAKLRAATSVGWDSRSKLTIAGNEGDVTSHVVVKDFDHSRQEFEGDFGGNKLKGVTVLNGDKGWRKLGEIVTELDAPAIANQKRVLYLQVIPATLVALKGKGFKARVTGEEDVDGKSAAVVKVTPPDGKDFVLYFDRDSGRPVKLVAKVVGFQGEEYTQQTTYADYKDFGGIKKATKIRSTRDGEPFLVQDINDFKVLDKFDPDLLAEPK